VTRRGAIGICTFRRPDDLGVLLATLMTLLPYEDDGQRFEQLIIVENDPDHSADVVVAQTRRSAELRGIGIEHVRFGKGNIAEARNEVLDAAKRLQLDDLAFLDDDEVPEPMWLAELLRTRKHRGADMVFGPVVGTTPPGTAAWIVEGRFFEFIYAEGEDRVTDGLSGNALVDLHFVRKHQLRFDPSLGRSGGEDQRFFREAARLGAAMWFSPKAMVRERVPVQRCSSTFLVRRYFRTGNALGVLSRDSIASAATCFVKGLAHIAIGTGGMIPRSNQRESAAFRSAQFRAARGAGMILGVLGGRYEFYAAEGRKLTWQFGRYRG
jgi:succinoglycan biosynthesis protein ExoM